MSAGQQPIRGLKQSLTQVAGHVYLIRAAWSSFRTSGIPVKFFCGTRTPVRHAQGSISQKQSDRKKVTYLQAWVQIPAYLLTNSEIWPQFSPLYNEDK